MFCKRGQDIEVPPKNKLSSAQVSGKVSYHEIFDGDDDLLCTSCSLESFPVHNLFLGSSPNLRQICNMYVVVSGANRSHGQSFGTHISFSSCGNHSRFAPAPAGVFSPL